MSPTTVLPWVLSCTTLVTMWLAGNKNPLAWRIGLASQALWLWYATLTHAYGLMPLSFVLGAIYIRNAQKWRRTPND